MTSKIQALRKFTGLDLKAVHVEAMTNPLLREMLCPVKLGYLTQINLSKKLSTIWIMPHRKEFRVFAISKRGKMWTAYYVDLPMSALEHVFVQQHSRYFDVGSTWFSILSS